MPRSEHTKARLRPRGYRVWLTGIAFHSSSDCYGSHLPCQGCTSRPMIHWLRDGSDVGPTPHASSQPASVADWPHSCDLRHEVSRSTAAYHESFETNVVHRTCVTRCALSGEQTLYKESSDQCCNPTGPTMHKKATECQQRKVDQGSYPDEAVTEKGYS